MDVTRLTALGRGWHQRLRTVFDSPIDAEATPLEIAQAVLDDVERHVEPAGRGRRILPYTSVDVRVWATDADVARIDAVLADLPRRIAERLAEVRCEPVASLVVTCVVSPERPQGWEQDQRIAVAYGRGAVRDAEDPTPAPVSAAPPCLRLAVVKGEVAEGALEFRGGTVAIGRGLDPAAEQGTRRNRIAFVDGPADAVNGTVGRAHARIRYMAESRDYRLFDEGSRNGTSVLRDGAVIVVPRRDPRGVRLRDGDEIRVGRAILQVALDAS